MDIIESKIITIAQSLNLEENTTRNLLNTLLEVWQLSEKTSAFPCVQKCTACCSNAAITCSVLEYETIKAHDLQYTPNPGFGCVFKNKTGCSIYEFRPLVCRLFGYYIPFEAPSVIFQDNLLGQKLALSVGTPGFCSKKRINTSLTYTDLENIMAKYRVIVQATKIVTMGTFKEKDLNQGLVNIDKLWRQQNKRAFWICE